MFAQVEKPKENKSRTVAYAVAQTKSSGQQGFGFVDNRPEAIQMRKFQEMANNSPQASQQRAFQDMDNSSPQTKQAAPLQTMADNYSEPQKHIIQRVEREERGVPARPSKLPTIYEEPITEDELLSQKGKLKKTPGMSTMYPHVNLTRGGDNVGHDNPEDFLEFATNTRRDMTVLSSTESGQEIFDTIGKAGKEVTLQDRGVDPKHGGSHRAHDREAAMDPKRGSDSTVTHQPNRTLLDPRPHAAPTSSVISLGHELIHSTHSATGVLQDGTHIPSGVKNEERHTVGNPSGKRPKSKNPTENTLRIDLAKEYGGIDKQHGGKVIRRTKYGKTDLGFSVDDDQY